MTTALFIAWLKDIGIERFELQCISGELDSVESSRVIWKSQMCNGELVEGEEILEAREKLNGWTKQA
ncbi:MAG: hypothetical protein V4730_00005 [Pseudomonadota bacterium]